MKIKRLIKLPLTKSSETKARVFYKQTYGFPKNSSFEDLQKSLGISNKRIASNVMADIYNENIILENQKIYDSRTIAKKENQEKRKVENKRKREAKKQEKIDNEKFTFIIELRLQTTYKQDYYETEEKKRYSIADVVIREETTEPYTEPKKNIPDIILQYFYEDDYKIIIVLKSIVKYMNVKEMEKNRKQKTKQTMTSGFILRNDWLK